MMLGASVAGAQEAPDAGVPAAAGIDAGIASVTEAGALGDGGPEGATAADGGRDGATPSPGDAVDASVDGADAGIVDGSDGGTAPPMDEAEADVQEAPSEEDPSVVLAIETAVREVFRGFFRDRQTREAEPPPSGPAASPPTQEPRQINVEVSQPAAPEPRFRSVWELLGFEASFSRVDLFRLALFFLLGVAVLAVLRRAAVALPERGAVPRAVSALRFTVRGLLALTLLLFIGSILPVSLPVLLIMVVAAGVAAGVAVWVFVPDVLAALVLLTEARIRRHAYVQTEDFEGTVVGVGPRQTRLTAPNGVLLLVPNRRLLERAVRVERRRWPRVTVELEAPPGVDPLRLRAALGDAILGSPYIPADADPELVRLPEAPQRWTVTVCLLALRFAPRFRGELRERLEEVLAADGVTPADEDAADA
jgi:small-conductance mechanosensitive channel